MRNAVIATGLQLEWNYGQEDPFYFNALSDYPTPMPHSPAPISQKDMQENVQSAIKNLRSVSELRQWSHERHDPRILRALADLGDMDAFLLLLLLGMNDIQTFSEF